MWEFEVREGCETAFLEAYASDGIWARLFRKSPEFLGVELVQSVKRPMRYFTLDAWTSRRAFEDFRLAYCESYETLDVKLAGLTEWERQIGAFPSE
ncbi:antibiotic biosynthesis monooxygenase [Acidobacterium sp. S8]|jgi:heme-degrading monooxygenase HmoA|uniref:antibiotic biosynthesis monooxygenase family protein n=1 Tax=Acidobacterium sp. S8 TaxID=1641854 RepID=UPI00210FB6CC|nr:antibiotic biosynthesis monooxygenase [Acidobacterium sp. S8]